MAPATDNGSRRTRRAGVSPSRIIRILVLALLCAIGAPLRAQEEKGDTLRIIPPPIDTADAAKFRPTEGPAFIPEIAPERQAEIDSILAYIRRDSLAAADTIAERPGVRLAVAKYDSLRHPYGTFARQTAWPLPQPLHLAAVDAGGWLLHHPAYDVDDAHGVAQSRRHSRWGLAERQSPWTANGRPVGGRRLTFPQDIRFDPLTIAPYDYDSIHASLGTVMLDMGDRWPGQAQSSYVLRQGDFGETYSQGQFRRLLPRGYGADLGFAFYENSGPFFSDSRDTRHLRLNLAGPVAGVTGWSAQFEQYRDKTFILPGLEYGVRRPRRNDLHYNAAASFYHVPDTGAVWAAGLRRESAKHDLRDIVSGFRRETHEHRWSIWGERRIQGWDLHAEAVLDVLDTPQDESTRWGGLLSGKRILPLREGSVLLDWRISDWDSDPIAPEIEATLHLADSVSTLVPGIKVGRTRIIPSLLERNATPVSVDLDASGGSIIREYSEAGDPGLQAEWRNSLTLFAAKTPEPGERGLHLVLEGHAAYTEGHTRWRDIDAAFDTASYMPVSSDARSGGVGFGLHAPLFWKFETWASYALKYAETISHDRLEGYNPHKAVWILSWIAPQLRYGIDLRLNSAVLWWYGDRRITPTPYASSPNVARWDLSATAQMKSFVFHFSVQNITNFPYRTRAGEEYAVRALRFGFDWQFLD